MARLSGAPPDTELEDLRDDRLTAGEMAAHYGVSLATIHRWLRSAGIDLPRGNPNTNGQRAAVKAPPETSTDYHPAETHRGKLPLQGPALRLPPDQQAKVGRLLALFRYHEIERARAKAWARGGTDD